MHVMALSLDAFVKLEQFQLRKPIMILGAAWDRLSSEFLVFTKWRILASILLVRGKNEDKYLILKVLSSEMEIRLLR